MGEGQDAEPGRARADGDLEVGLVSGISAQEARRLARQKLKRET